MGYVEVLHSEDVVHGDLKMENMLTNYEEESDEIYLTGMLKY